MNNAKLPVLLYFIVSLVYLTGVLFDNDSLELYTKPLIIPSMVWYCYSSFRFHKNKNLILLFFLFYTGDMSYLLVKSKPNYIGLMSFLLVYILVISYFLKTISANHVGAKLDKAFIYTAFALFTIMLSLLVNIELDSKVQFFIYFIVSAELVLMGVLSSYLYYLKADDKSIYMLLAVICFILSDLFFAFYNNFFQLKILELINTTFQTLSYFFVAKYLLVLNNEKKI